jgi:hypothetical protein
MIHGQYSPSTVSIYFYFCPMIQTIGCSQKAHIFVFPNRYQMPRDDFMFMHKDAMLLMLMFGEASCCIPSGKHLHLHSLCFNYIICCFNFPPYNYLFYVFVIIFGSHWPCVFSYLQHNIWSVCFVIFFIFSVFVFLFLVYNVCLSFC